jgi:hypothetical protein
MDEGKGDDVFQGIAKASKKKHEREIQERSSNRSRLECGFQAKGLQSERIAGVA